MNGEEETSSEDGFMIVENEDVSVGVPSQVGDFEDEATTKHSESAKDSTRSELGGESDDDVNGYDSDRCSCSESIVAEQIERTHHEIEAAEQEAELAIQKVERVEEAEAKATELVETVLNDMFESDDKSGGGETPESDHFGKIGGVSPSKEEASLEGDKEAQSAAPSAAPSISLSQIHVNQAHRSECDEEDSQANWDSVSQCVSEFFSATIPENLDVVESLINRMVHLGGGKVTSEHMVDEIASLGGVFDRMRTQPKERFTGPDVSASEAQNSNCSKETESSASFYDESWSEFFQVLSNREVVQALQDFIHSSAFGNLITAVAAARASDLVQVGKAAVPHIPELMIALARLMERASELAIFAPLLVHWVSTWSASKSKVGSSSDGPAKDRTEQNDECSAPTPTPTSAPVPAPEPLVVHRHVLCDGCDTPAKKAKSVQAGHTVSGYIAGIRWKSAIHDDTDFCSTCEASGEFEEEYGPMLKIVSPKKAPRQLVVLLKEDRQPKAAAAGAPKASAPSFGDPRQRRRTNLRASRGSLLPDARSNSPYLPFLRPYCRGSSTMATARASSQVGCPGGHELVRFQTPGGFSCDVCQEKMPFNAILKGCRKCNWDACQKCLPQEVTKESEPINLKADVPVTNHGERTKPAPTSKVTPATSVPVQHQQVSRPRAKFVADISLPDGSVVEPNACIIKTWRVCNSGTTVWPQDVRLVNVGGEQMQGESGMPVPALDVGAQHDLELSLVAPSKPGRYVGYWRLAMGGPSYLRFGHRLWVDVLVVNSNNTGTPEDTGVEVAGDPEISSSELTAAERWSKELDSLAEMGFTNTMELIPLLEAENGEVATVIEKLVQ
mmetsp:Transcript_11565/g.20535  ORF Transcript_11565/g.20535 Transcript_11565/m.20535 type:complete len:843 (-) Transcript_11565:137-2665(-)